MPSPSIPRSKSTPDISGAHGDPHSPSHSDVLSRRTSWSENSPRTWPRKLGAFIARKTSSSSSKKPTLTVESLEEFNRLNEILEESEERKFFQSSPYYKGLSRLNDSSPDLYHQRRPSTPNPYAESHAGSLMSATTKTSFVYKMHGWGSSCFLSREKDDQKIAVVSSTSSRRKRESAKKVGKNVTWTNMGDVTNVPLNTEKPLRERVLQPPSPPPTPPYPGPLMPLSAPRQTTIQAPVQADPPPSTQSPPRQMTIQTPPQVEPPQPAPSTQSPPRQTTIQKLAQAEPEPPPSTDQAQELQTIPPPTDQAQEVQTKAPQLPKESADLPITMTQAASETEQCKPENERKYIWADRYRPYALKDFLCNRNKALELESVAKSESCGHFIFEGQPGVGKKTMIWAFLREAFGEDNVQAREESKKFILKGEAIGSINVKIQQSSKHVEINISELRGYEKHVIVELIKEKNDKPTENACNPRDNCRAIILYDADKLPTEALLYIRWVLERYKACNKLFFCCSDASKIEPIGSLCTLVQLLPPSNEEITEVLEFIAEKERIRLPKELAAKIAKSAKNNLRQAIRSFEATWHFNSILEEDQEIMTGWEYDIANIARNVIEEQSPKQLYIIRGKLQNLIEHNVSAEYIFETLVKELKKNLNEQFQKQIDNLYEIYTKNDDSKKLFAPHQQEEMGKRLHDPVKRAVQHFLKIEEFIAKFMSWYKSWLSTRK